MDKTIADLRPGESGVIKGYTDDILYLKLMEMGCLPGTKIRVNFTAPFGDPISIVLWVMASYGPGDHVTRAEQYVLQGISGEKPDKKTLQKQVESYKLEHSYAGIFGKLIEPAIRPLGYDWKIGIALITSFAAREIFVGTMATIYSIGSDQESTIRKRMKEEINPGTGGPMYTPAVAFSLLIFYAFAMQCMSTLAIVHRETRSWKWPLIQLLFMSGLAYISSFFVYHLLK